MNDSFGDWFRTTVGVRQGFLRLPIIFNFFSRTDLMFWHDRQVSIGGRNVNNLRFADDIDALAEVEQELEALI